MHEEKREEKETYERAGNSTKVYECSKYSK